MRARASGKVNGSTIINRLHDNDRIHVFVILLFVLLFAWQINWYPAERFPEWDNYWHDVLQCGRLVTSTRALAAGEIPAIDPYTGFGNNHAGDLNSPWGPGPLFMLTTVLSPRTVLYLSQLILMGMGAVGAYLFLRRFTTDRFICLLCGITYCSTWVNLGGSSFQSTRIWSFYFLPLLLLIIHWVLDRKSALSMVVFAACCTIVLGTLDTFALFSYPAAIFTYVLVVSWQRGLSGILTALKRALLLVLLALLGGAIYLVPLYWNCQTILQALDQVREAVPAAAAARGEWMLPHRFFAAVKYMGGFFEPIYQPTSNSYTGGMYVPAAFYATIIMAAVFARRLFGGKYCQLGVSGALLLFYPAMLLVDYVYWSPLSRLWMGLRETAADIMAAPLNLTILSFSAVLVTFLCFAAIRDAKSKKLKITIYALVVVASLLADWRVFSTMGAGVAPFEPSSRVPISVAYVLWLYPVANVLPVLLLICYDLFVRPDAATRRPVAYSSCLIATVLLALFTITIHNAWNVRCGAGERMVCRDAYRWDNYQARKARIDELIDRSDPNFRVLYCGTGKYSSDGADARNWKAIAETEMHVAGPYKTLFSYREYTHPYEGLMRSLVGGGGFQRWEIFPPLTREVEASIADIKQLMGIKYVLSLDETLDSPHLIYRGNCGSAQLPDVYEQAAATHDVEYWSEAGPVHIYEVIEPTGIAFLVDNYKKVSVSESLKAIYENREHPWNENAVYIEDDPADDTLSLAPLGNASGQEPSARIVKESYRGPVVRVSTPKEKFLVLSYLHRPFWKAYIGSVEVPIFRAYGGFMCVKVPPGEHAVKFRYWPIDVYIGILLTALSFIVPMGLKQMF